jgi:hypothetical protein
VLRQQAFDDFFAIAEVRLLQQFDSVFEVDQLPLGGEVQDAEGSSDLDPLACGGSISSTLVNERRLRLEFDSERDSGAFAGIETGEVRIVMAAGVERTEPYGGRSDLGSDGWRQMKTAANKP